MASHRETYSMGRSSVPLRPRIARADDLILTGVSRKEEPVASEVEEVYSCDASGIVKVRICNRSSAYHREYTLGSWSKQAPQAAEAITGKHGWRPRHRQGN